MNHPASMLKIEIKDPMIRAYFRSKVCSRNNDGLRLSTNSITGLVLCSMVEPSATRPDYPTTNQTVSVVIPRSSMNNHLLGRFLILHPNNLTKILLILRREFNVDFSIHLFTGLSAGLSKKRVVEMFISEFGLDEIPTAFETLSKKRQRHVESNVRISARRLRNRAVYEIKKAQNDKFRVV